MHTRSVLREAPSFLLSWVTRAGLIAGALLCLLVSARPGIAQSPPVPIHPGHWSDRQDWGQAAIHMALLPGDGTYHSKILWWHGSDATHPNLDGDVRGWRWNASADQCGSFGDFTQVPVIQAPYDIFCSGFTHTPDGQRLLIAGGSVLGEIGVQKAAYFNPTILPPASPWSEVASPMASRRWYPTVQLLPDGRVLAASGSMYQHLLAFGGTTVPGSAAQAQGDLHRLQLTEASAWDPTIPFRTAPDWPPKRFGHSLAGRNPSDTQTLFGGLGTDAQYRNDTWALGIDQRPTEGDNFYYWEERTITGQKPLARMEHSAVVLNDLSMIVYGGRDLTQVFNEVWRLSHSTQTGLWSWELLTQEPVTQGGPLPGGRFGQAAIYQYSTEPPAPVRDRALVFGGATTIAGQLADNDVWELTVDLGQHKAKWRKLAVESGSPKPAARYEHAMAPDPFVRKREQSAPLMWRMFVSGGRGVFGHNTLSDELWQLWDVDANTVAWSSLPAGPSRRARHSLTYDPGRHYLVLMGGDTGGLASNQVWEINVECGTCPPSFQPQWTEVTPANSPALSGQTAHFVGNALYARKPERFTSAAGWQTLNAPLLQEWYPYQFTIANGPNAGKVFNAGPSVASYLLDLATPSWITTAGSGFVGGSAVLYRADRVMKCGTRDTQLGDTAVTTTKFIALDGATPSWVASDDMDSGRVNHNLTILPSGEVLVNGGTEIARNSGNQGLSRGLVELWRPPDTTYPNGIWYGGSGTNALEPSTAARDYHSAALLLPDGRVLTASGNASPQINWAQIYCPPYLFTASGGGRVSAGDRLDAHEHHVWSGVRHRQAVGRRHLLGLPHPASRRDTWLQSGPAIRSAHL